jgi:hypothetical protein
LFIPGPSKEVFQILLSGDRTGLDSDRCWIVRKFAGIRRVAIAAASQKIFVDRTKQFSDASVRGVANAAKALLG